jgi:hypothetical protein
MVILLLIQEANFFFSQLLAIYDNKTKNLYLHFNPYLMKTKILHLILSLIFILNYNSLFAQMKMLSNGNVGIGTLTPVSTLQVVGYTTFTANNGSITSAGLIRGNNNYSTATTPDFTWYTNDQTGLFHPSPNVIGFSTGGYERMRISNGPTYTLLIYGNAYASGGVWTPSDIRYKKNIQTIDGALNKVLKLNGKAYEFKTDEFKNKNFNKGSNLGFIAQELKEIIPEAVNIDSNGYQSINYDEIIPVLVEAIKELNFQVGTLKNKTNTNEAINKSVEGLSKDINNGASLSQNAPNPFKENTSIGFYLPSTIKNAAFYIYDLQGKQLKSYNVSDREHGTIVIQGSESLPGMYYYSLIADGNVIGTEKMILTE